MKELIHTDNNVMIPQKKYGWVTFGFYDTYPSQPSSLLNYMN